MTRSLLYRHNTHTGSFILQEKNQLSVMFALVFYYKLNKNKTILNDVNHLMISFPI